MSDEMVSQEEIDALLKDGGAASPAEAGTGEAETPAAAEGAGPAAPRPGGWRRGWAPHLGTTSA